VHLGHQQHSERGEGDREGGKEEARVGGRAEGGCEYMINKKEARSII